MHGESFFQLFTEPSSQLLSRPACFYSSYVYLILELIGHLLEGIGDAIKF